MVVGVEEFLFGFLVGEDFEEEYLYYLGDVLCVVVYVGVFVYDVVYVFDDGGDIVYWC